MGLTRLKLLLPIIIIVILVVGIAVGVVLSQRQQQFASKAASPAHRIAFLPDRQGNIGKNTVFDVQVYIDAGSDNRISGVDFTLNYNDKLGFQGFEPNRQSGLETQVISNNDPFKKSFRYVGVNKTGSLPYYTSLHAGTLKLVALSDGVGNADFSSVQVVSSSGNDAITLIPVNGRYTIGGDDVCSSDDSACGSTQACIDADADGNKCVDRNDFNIWFGEYTQSINSKNADFYNTCSAGGRKGDGKINLLDLSVWMREFAAGKNRCG